jgi:hypothetical protein
MSQEMRDHLSEEVTYLATCVEIIPQQDTHMPPDYLTEHDRSILFNGNTYSPANSFQLSEIQMSTDFASDNCELTLGEKTYDDLETYRNADINIFLINWQHVEWGKIPLFTGFVTNLELDEHHQLKLTVGGVGRKLSEQYLPKYSRTCRAKLGDSKCGFPVYMYGRKNKYQTYPMTFEVGETYLRMPTTSTGITNPETKQPIPAGMGPTNIIIADFNPICTEAHIIQYNGNDIIQDVWDKKDVRNIAAFVLPNTTHIQITTPDNGVTVTAVFADKNDIPVEKDKLARVTSRNYYEHLDVVDPDFVESGDISNTTNPDHLHGWEITSTTGYSIHNGILYSSGVTELEQTIQIPVLSCTLLSEGCYYMDWEFTVPEVNNSATVQITTYDQLNNVIYDHTIDLSAETRHRFRLTGDPASVKIKLNLDSAKIDKADCHVYSALMVKGTDPKTITLNSFNDMAVAEDIWETNTTQMNWFASITQVTTDTRVFTVDNTDDLTIGTLVFLSGPNAGIKRDVFTFDQGAVELFVPLPNTCDVGDEVMLVIGCDNQIQTCAATFNNAFNFRGEPFMPTAETLTQISEL